MKRLKLDGGFWVCVGINLLLQAEWLLPAAIALVLHFWKGVSLWWTAGLAVVYFAVVILSTLLLGLAAGCNSPGVRYTTPHQADFDLESDYARWKSSRENSSQPHSTQKNPSE